MKLNILLFGPYADTLAASSVAVNVPDHAPPTAGAVMTCLAEQQPLMREMLATAVLSINCQFARPEQTVTENDELAIIGLVGGG